MTDLDDLTPDELAALTPAPFGALDTDPALAAVPELDVDADAVGEELPHATQVTEPPAQLPYTGPAEAMLPAQGVAPLTGRTIPAKGSGSRRGATVRLVGVHSAEGSTTVGSLGGYFASTDKGSSHGGIDNGSYAQFVAYDRAAFTNPPVNREADTVELCAFARWTREQWLAHGPMLELLARWIAWRCSRRSIPIRLISGAQAVAGAAGVIDHARINDGYHKSTHRDVGGNFPWDVVIPRAQAIAGVKPKPAPVQPKGADRDLRQGMQGQDVKNVQNALHQLGFLPGDPKKVVDGIFGPGTTKALKAFQHAHKAPEDGVCNAGDWAMLRTAIGH